ncbi:unnamed protein product [Dimorphilus gyrociliatus]|uniref:Uncharacterized protein n=1 Tax=Dimorphilus gyrociliatus TaxID=2664684 RepID=A0A7I8W3U7_9ANNE|nr:unnamed protein product [Dimorphilus gyrociliatus]
MTSSVPPSRYQTPLPQLLDETTCKPIFNTLKLQMTEETTTLRRDLEDMKRGYQSMDLKSKGQKEELSDLGSRLCLLRGRCRVKCTQISEKRSILRSLRWSIFELQQENDALKSQLLTLEKQGINIADIRKRYCKEEL